MRNEEEKAAGGEVCLGMILFGGVWLLLGLLSGCSAPECPAECPAGQICDSTLGQCVARPLPCAGVTCGEHEQCNQLTGRCEPVPDCVAAGCPAGETCNTRSRLCEEGPGCEVEGCPPGLQCDAERGRCYEPVCQRDSDCPPGAVCDGAGLCLPGCRPTHPCGRGQICRLGEDEDHLPGSCVNGCLTDRDCGWGRVCQGVVATGAAGRCADEPPCNANSECRTDEICVRSSCVRGPCTEGIPCDEDEFCNADTGSCQQARCRDDQFEPNDDPGLATELRPQRYSSLMLCAGNVDVYRVQVALDRQLTATIRFDPTVGDLDLLLRDRAGGELAASRTTGPSETLTYRGTEPQEVFLEVLGFGSSQAAYALEFWLEEARCQEDGLAPNQRFQHAAPLADEIPHLLRLCPGAGDWLQLEAALGDGLRLQFESSEPVPAGSFFRLILLDAAGDRHAAQGWPGEPTLTLEVPAIRQAGLQYVLIRGEVLPEAGLAYRLRVFRQPVAATCVPDRYDPNHREEQAVPLPPGRHEGLTLCPAQPDWFRIERSAGQALAVTVLPTLPWPDQQPPDLVLLDWPGQRPIATSQLRGGQLIVRAEAEEQAGSYLLGVLPAADGLPLTYALTLTEEAPPPCLDDALEAQGNDEPARATWLPPGVQAALRWCPASPVDWYRVALLPGEGLRVRFRLEELAADPETRLALWSSDGAELVARGTADGRGSQVALLLAPPPGGCLVQVAVNQVGAAGIGYRLAIEPGRW